MIKRWRRTSAALGDIPQTTNGPDNDDLAYQAEVAQYSQARIYSKPQSAAPPPVVPGPERQVSRSFGKSRFGN